MDINIYSLLAEASADEHLVCTSCEGLAGMVYGVSLCLPTLIDTSKPAGMRLDADLLDEAARRAVHMAAAFTELNTAAVMQVMESATARSSLAFWQQQLVQLTEHHQGEVGLAGVLEAVAMLTPSAVQAGSVVTSVLTEVEAAVCRAAQREAAERGWAPLQRGDGPMLLVGLPLADAPSLDDRASSACVQDVDMQAAVVAAVQPWVATGGPRVARLLCRDASLSVLTVQGRSVQADDAWSEQSVHDGANGIAEVTAVAAPAAPASPVVVEKRPEALDCDVVRFQNNKEKWVAFVGLLDGRPYEIFTGLQDEDEGIVLPKSVTKGRIIKQLNADGTKRYDFQFQNKRGYKTTVEGLSEKFNPEYWNYAKLLSGVLRYGMPLDHVIRLVGQLSLQSESINTWKNGVRSALKRYLPDDDAKADDALTVAP